MTGEPTVPVPTSDLLADIEWNIAVLESMAHLVRHPEVENASVPVALIRRHVRGVRDLAARAETLTEYVEANETLSGARRRTSNAEWSAALDAFQAARRALLEEAK